MSVDRSALPVGGLQCYICHESVKSRESSTVGHTQKCAQLGCDRRMHVTCAQDRRLLRMPLKAGILDLAPDAGERVLFCEVHKEATPDPSPVKKSSKEQPSITLDDGTVIRVGDHVKVGPWSMITPTSTPRRPPPAHLYLRLRNRARAL